MHDDFDLVRGKLIGELGKLEFDEKTGRGQYFNIIFFRQKAEPFSASLLPATVANRLAVANWLRGIRPSSQTDPVPALQLAFKLRPQYVVVLSDGEFEAVLEAGPVRLRPILMTSMSIILGMIPTAMAYGAAGTFRAPMAITVIGGVFSSTLLSLVVVPVVYTLLDDIVSLVSRVFHRGATVTVPSQETSPAEDPPRQDRSDPDRDDVR
jgi:hypothetical protein